METRALHRLESLCEAIRSPGIECTASVRIEIPYEEILGEAEKIAPDLIVLGGKGYSALARILLGGTAEQVVRFARCSVLVARHPPNQLPSSPAGNA
jgi:nucleotide-binding universal stress UspA family protein